MIVSGERSILNMLYLKYKTLNKRIHSHTYLIPLLLPVFLIIPLNAASAQDQSYSIDGYKVDNAPTIDGRLNEESWQNAETATDFLQFEPTEGEAASYQTEVKVMYGKGNLYIGAILYDEHPGKILQTLGRRDEINRADWFFVSVDAHFDQTTAYAFGVNAAGIQFDGINSGGGNTGNIMSGVDISWDAVWYSSVRVTDRGWIVEMRIPYNMLRFSEEDVQQWGIHFTRRIPRFSEISEWPFIPRTQRENLVAQYGRMTNIRNIKPKPNIQVIPYSLGRLNARESTADPGQLTTSFTMDVGGDIKIGLGPNVTLDATFNPDFGQVESDPAVLNLTAFETFYEERRPFFLEGINIYEFSVGPGEMLYTRRIGEHNPIIGATKVTGQTANDFSFGVLGATTGSQFNPSRNYGVVRINQQFNDLSKVGGIITGFDGPYPGGAGRIQSVTGGANYDLRLADNYYGIEGFTAFTHRNWTSSNKETRTGFAGKVWFRKRQGVFTGFTGFDVYSDKFNPNDLGQFRRNNFIAPISGFNYQLNKGNEFGPFRRASIRFFGLQQYSYRNRLNLGINLNMGSRWKLKGFQTLEGNMSLNNLFGGYDLYETRGLGPWAEPYRIEFGTGFSTDERRSWQVNPQVEYTITGDNGRGYSFEVGANWNAGTQISLSGQLRGEWEQDMTAWVANESFKKKDGEWMIGRESASPNRLSTDEFITFEGSVLLDNILENVEPYSDKTYYVPVFGARDTRSLDFTLRSTITFMKDLSLQLYNQLFLARGHYDNFQILQNRDELADFDSYPKRSDFTLNSLQTNVVLRWEYRPGSTLFLVWTHGRSKRERQNPLAHADPSPYYRGIDERVGDVFSIFPSNVFLLKMRYTFLY